MAQAAKMLTKWIQRSPLDLTWNRQPGCPTRSKHALLSRGPRMYRGRAETMMGRSRSKCKVRRRGQARRRSKCLSFNRSSTARKPATSVTPSRNCRATWTRLPLCRSSGSGRRRSRQRRRSGGGSIWRGRRGWLSSRGGRSLRILIEEKKNRWLE